MIKSLNITQLETGEGYKTLSPETLNMFHNSGFNTIRLEVELTSAESIASMKGPKLYQLPAQFIKAIHKTILNCQALNSSCDYCSTRKYK